jgi:hypothetical protein
MEITLGLLACCLPTLRGLIQTKSVDSVFKNVRSMFSLGSSTSESRVKSSGSSEGITGITVQTKMSQDSKGSHFEDV